MLSSMRQMARRSALRRYSILRSSGFGVNAGPRPRAARALPRIGMQQRQFLIWRLRRNLITGPGGPAARYVPKPRLCRWQRLGKGLLLERRWRLLS
jgi:hypothetical protein